jgi:hypothetical protein
MASRSSIADQRAVSAADAATRDRRAADARGAGWVTFAGTMLAIVGVMNVVYGIAAIADSRFYARDVTFVFANLNTWGWILTVVGVVQLAAAMSIFAATAWGRWVGILTAGLNAVAQLLFLPSYPLLSLALFSVDILVIYGLVSYGGRREPAV